MYQPRTYRQQMDKGRFTSFTVTHYETDLWVGVDPGSFKPQMIDLVKKETIALRQILIDYSKICPTFFSSLEPLEVIENQHHIIQRMIKAGQAAGTGPMAAVAGAFDEYIANILHNSFNINELIIENGGDIYTKLITDSLFSIYAGESPLSEKIGVRIPANCSPLGICTSSGTVGHSFSFGKADAVMIICNDTILADAYATAFANNVKSTEDIAPTIELASQISDIQSIIIIKDEKIGVKGYFQLELI